MSSNKYDIIIAGGGLSGLSLAWYLAKGEYKGEVLIVDSTFAPMNTKTWCFWKKEKPPFHEIVYKKWRKTFFSALDFDAFLYMHEHTYYCIRESDFKEYVLTELQQRKNFHLLEESILDFSSNQKKAALVTKSSDTYLADYIFQSIFNPQQKESKKPKYPLVQHFLGLEIKTTIPVFDPETLTIMDFDGDFDDGLAFIYILPFRQNRALIEYTIFSPSPLKKKKEYRTKIKKYLKDKFNLSREDYEIKRKEYGEIPMEDRSYAPTYAPKIINIGTVGGLTKPSTGYTFTRIQKYSKNLANSIIQGNEVLLPPQSESRYRYYDLLLLHILSNSSKESLHIFRDLFKNNSIDKVFDFLSEDTNFAEDLKIMSSVPYTPFLKAISRNL
ncbi:MAG: lycopene cyclase family protein [Balneolaceae bacterium]